MTETARNLASINNLLQNYSCRLVAVSKTKPESLIMEAYTAGQRIFGENKVQEMVSKAENLPKDIDWHLIGHLQTNKVKYIAPFVGLIHSVDSLKLLKEINKEAKKYDRVINCLLQIYIAVEETKFGLDFSEAEHLLNDPILNQLENIKVLGLMGMATNTNDKDKIRTEFKSLKLFFENLKSKNNLFNVDLKYISMGMSSDFQIALEEGSNFIRVGSLIFGNR